MEGGFSRVTLMRRLRLGARLGLGIPPSSVRSRMLQPSPSALHLQPSPLYAYALALRGSLELHVFFACVVTSPKRQATCRRCSAHPCALLEVEHSDRSSPARRCAPRTSTSLPALDARGIRLRYSPLHPKQCQRARVASRDAQARASPVRATRTRSARSARGGQKTRRRRRRANLPSICERLTDAFCKTRCAKKPNGGSAAPMHGILRQRSDPW